MTANITKQEQRQLDGFATYTDEVEGDDRTVSTRAKQGVRLKFTNEATWIVAESGEELPTGLEVIAIDVGREVLKWVDEKIVDSIVLGPGEKFPDIDKLNAQCPETEWREGLGGQPQGPWQAQHILYLLDLKTMTPYWWPTSTIGGVICIRNLVDRVNWMRKYKSENAYAVVEFSDTFMNTRFGGRQRPHLNIKRFEAFRSATLEQAALTKPSNVVEKPTAKEVTGDEIPY
jgi:hypothetical protein